MKYYNFHKCPNICQSKDLIKEHIKSEHSTDIGDIDIKTKVRVCSICDDKFLTKDTYTRNQEHLRLILNILTGSSLKLPLVSL